MRRREILVTGLVLLVALGSFVAAGSVGAGEDPCPGCRQHVQELIAEIQARGWWGAMVTSCEPGRFGIEAAGLLVMQVTPDGPAERAGLRERDVIVSIDDTELGSLGDDAIGRFLGEIRPGDRLDMIVNRRGRSVSMEVVAARISHDELANALGHRLLQRYAPARKPQVFGDPPPGVPRQ